MPDLYNKPSYSRKQKLYVEKTTSSRNRKANKNNRKRRKSYKPYVSFVLIAFSVAMLVTGVFGSSIYFYKQYAQNSQNAFSGYDSNKDNNNENNIDDPLIVEKEKENVNILLIGFDEGRFHTDTMILANLNTVDGSIELISIPRDTYTELPQHVVDQVYANSSNPIMPRDGMMKLTEVITYTQDLDLGLEILTNYVADLFNISIDAYVAVDLESFSYLIDEVGGVYFDVPRRMYYTDNAQGLYIDLQPGYQLLNGDKSEQLMRFRKGVGEYPNGDLGRIQTQQAFLKALINQVLGKENIVSNLIPLAKTYFNYVTTSLNVLDVPIYAEYALKADRNNIKTYSMPNEYKYVVRRTFAVPIEDEMHALSQKVFYDIEPEVVTDDELNNSLGNTSNDSSNPPTNQTTSSNNNSNNNPDNSSNEINISDSEKSSYKIIVLNGSHTVGLAGKTKNLLTNEGFTIDSIGDHTGTQSSTTRLFVNDKNKAEPFKQYFDSSEVVYTPNQKEDLIVVLGIGETLKGK